MQQPAHKGDVCNVSDLVSAQVEAGRDILNTAFTGQNNSASDVTSTLSPSAA